MVTPNIVLMIRMVDGIPCHFGQTVVPFSERLALSLHTRTYLPTTSNWLQGISWKE
jgi:hypothetical protein